MFDYGDICEFYDCDVTHFLIIFSMEYIIKILIINPAQNFIYALFINIIMTF